MTDKRAISEWVGGFMQSQTAEQVDSLFKRLDRLGEDDRRIAVDAAEKLFLEEFLFLMPAMTQNMGVSKTLVEQLQDKSLMKAFNEQATPKLGPLADILINAFQRQVQAAWNIHEIKKDQSDPITKALISKAAALAEDEYNSIGGALSVLLGTLEEFQDRKPKGGFGFGGGPAGGGPGSGPRPGGGPRFGGF